MSCSRESSYLAPKRVLFLEKVFLKEAVAQDQHRGVELFNVRLLREMAASGIAMSVIAHASWQDLLVEQGAEQDSSWWITGRGGPVLASLLPAARAGRAAYDGLLIANVGDSIVPAIRLINYPGETGANCLIAHRSPSLLFRRGLKALKPTVVAVNGIIAEQFRAAGYEKVHVYYGVSGAERFWPATEDRPSDAVRSAVLNSAVLHFAVLGRLDSPWKGADTAIEAFRALPQEWRGRVHLHLAGYARSPEITDANITAHSWLPADGIAEFLRTMDVLIVPSRDEDVMRETFSQAMVQGMLTGLPIIASNIQVLTEKLYQGGGIVFNSTDGLVEAIVRLAQDRELRKKLGAEARKTALARYLWDTKLFVAKYLFT